MEKRTDRRPSRVLLLAGIVSAAMAVSAPATAFDFLDGRVQVHGFFEEQVRGLARDFEGGDDWDLAQWYHVLNLEIDLLIAPDGWGPFDLVSGFARIEGRYDCVWTRGCGLLDNVNVYGDRAEHLPARLIDGRRDGFTGQLRTFDRRTYAGTPRLIRGEDPLRPGSGEQSNTTGLSGAYRFVRFGGNRDPIPFFGIPGIETLMGNRGVDGFLDGFPDPGNTGDDPAPFIFSRMQDQCVFAARQTRGSINGNGTQVLGPWNPECHIRGFGELRNRPNPFNRSDFNAILSGADRLPGTADDPASVPAPIGSTELPFRPAPSVRFEGSTFDPIFDASGNVTGFAPTAPQGRAAPGTPQGIFYPSPALAKRLRADKFHSFDQNFSQNELAWNRGASQQNEKELKELYLDLEALDSRLWIRAGKQNIVWGKTELFRTTDQFNPQDIALATLPSLEESRIALWAVRGVYSLYEIGPFEDVRVELAFNYDQFEPADIGRCGEPFSPNPVCNKTFGLLAHSFAGIALAGEERPPNPWDGSKGIEVGGRVEWRWSRFSFQISDFYGYNDFPHAERIFTYERNVDPATGRPRRAGALGSCTTGAEPSCLGTLPLSTIDPADGSLTVDPAARDDIIANHSANIQIFAMICSTSIGFSDLDRSVCAQSVLNSLNLASGLVPVTQAVGLMLRGNSNGKVIFNFLATGTTTAIPLRPSWAAALPDPSGSGVDGDLNGDGVVDPFDSPLVALSDEGTVPGSPDSDGGPAMVTTGPFFTFANDPDAGIDAALSDAQEALLGCGPFYGTSCDLHGVDLLNAEASALMQSWPGFEGTFEPRRGLWSTRDRTLQQPGTVDLGSDGVRGGGDDTVFHGGTPCGRVVGGVLVGLPGCRGPDDPGYDVDIDGRPPDVAASAGGSFAASDILVHPFTRQPFRSEMAALSWNGMMAFVALSGLGATPEEIASQDTLFDPNDPFGEAWFATHGTHRCSFDQPQMCSNVSAVYSVSGATRKTVTAGGNGEYGRRDFVWHGGGELVLQYERRNVLGFALDFAEDRTKSNWGAEFTWIEGLQFSNNNEVDGLTQADTFNLTVSVDRPTFINFLNPNRTFFFNSQWFFQYVDGYQRGFTTNGPFNVLATFTVQTGYSQDRLLPSATVVYDFQSASGGFLPSITYRFTENFSATVGINAFFGRWQTKVGALNPVSRSNQVGKGASKTFVENGLSVVRERDEGYLRIRYTF